MFDAFQRYCIENNVEPPNYKRTFTEHMKHHHLPLVEKEYVGIQLVQPMDVNE